MTENNDFNNTENDSTNSRNEKQFKLSEPNGAYLIDNDEPKYHWINDDDKIIDLLNSLNEENEELKKVLGAILLEVRRDISNTNQTGEIKVFINPNSFDLISEVLKKYGALKEWYE